MLQCIAHTVRQRVKLRQLDAVRLHAMLGQQILGGNDLLGLGTVADKRDTCAIDGVQQIVARACAGQRRQCGVLAAAGIADHPRAVCLAHKIGQPVAQLRIVGGGKNRDVHI